MLAAHHTAVKARLAAHTILSGKVGDAIRSTAGAEPVRSNFVGVGTVLVGFDPGENSSRLTDSQSPTGDVPMLVHVRYVAVDYTGVLTLVDAGNAQLVGHRLNVAGRSVSAFECEMDEPVYDRNSDMHYLDAFYEATTSRATA